MLLVGQVISSVKSLSQNGVFLVKVKNGINIEEVLDNDSSINLHEPNFIIRSYNDIENFEFDFTPNDENLGNNGILDIIKKLDQKYEMTQGADMKILEAWNAC